MAFYCKYCASLRVSLILYFSFNILDHVVSYSIYTHLRNNITRVLPIKNKITLIRGYDIDHRGPIT